MIDVLNIIMISKTLHVMAQLVEPHLDSIFFFFLRGMVLDSTTILWEEWVDSLRTTLNE